MITAETQSDEKSRRDGTGGTETPRETGEKVLG
jgi:hypothetical protein